MRLDMMINTAEIFNEQQVRKLKVKIYLRYLRSYQVIPFSCVAMYSKLCMFVLGETYDCYPKSSCSWADYTENTDWGYYSSTNGDCSSCRERCNNDVNCGGIECDDGDCSWWKKGSCHTNDVLGNCAKATTCLKTKGKPH